MRANPPLFIAVFSDWLLPTSDCLEKEFEYQGGWGVAKGHVCILNGFSL